MLTFSERAAPDTKAARLNQIFAALLALLLCLSFAWRLPELYSAKFGEVKKYVESYFAKPAKEAVLKGVFWDYIQLTNRGSVNNVYILDDGRLLNRLVPDPPLLQERAEAVITLKNYLEERETPFLFVRAPDGMKDAAQLPVGFENTVLEDGARFLALLEENGVKTLDLREEMIRDNLDFERAFFWGDHHWTAETALWAFGKTGALMNRQYGFELDERTWDPNEYEFKIYRNTFLGSMSTRIGDPRLKESITALIPKFPTSFEVSDKIAAGQGTPTEILASGDFADVFAPKAKLAQSNDFSYGSLNHFGEGLRHFSNAAAGNAKVLLVSDSFGCNFVTFLASAIPSVDYLYLQNSDKAKTNLKLYPVLAEESYDMVIFLAYDGTILGVGNDIKKDRMYLGEPVG